MRGYVLRRVLASIPVMLFVAVVTFSLLYLTPGDPAEVMAGDEATPEEVDEIRENLGLDRPMPVRLGIFLRDTLRGDLGDSVFSKNSVTKLIGQRVEPTLSIAILATLIAISLGLPLGVIAAWQADTWIDRTIMVWAVVGLALPAFFLGFLIMWGFGLQLRIFPVAGFSSLSDGLFDYLKFLILPSLAASNTFMSLIIRMTRASTLEVLRQDYVRTARAKGLAENVVLFRHAVKNAALPILTVVGFGVAFLISGLVVVESVFAVPGLGRLLVDAIARRDYPVIQGVVLVISAAYVLVNLGVDLLYSYADPRVRY
ncbi:ABC transporter permease [Dehalococcoidia bacterium]|nr:ABC transporter permease [Dehalococcoidia bacterium]